MMVIELFICWGEINKLFVIFFKDINYSCFELIIIENMYIEKNINFLLTYTTLLSALFTRFFFIKLILTSERIEFSLAYGRFIPPLSKFLLCHQIDH